MNGFGFDRPVTSDWHRLVLLGPTGVMLQRSVAVSDHL